MTATRRKSMKITGVTVASACVAGAIGTSGCAARRTASDIPSAPEHSYRREGDRVIVTLPEVDYVKQEGGAVKLTLYDGDRSELKVVLVHSEDESYRAFANRCTHRGKELDYLHEDRKLQCLSGKTQFDLEGNVVKGPAENALPRYHLRRVGQELVIEV